MKKLMSIILIFVFLVTTSAVVYAFTITELEIIHEIIKRLERGEDIDQIIQELGLEAKPDFTKDHVDLPINGDNYDGDGMDDPTVDLPDDDDYDSLCDDYGEAMVCKFL